MDHGETPRSQFGEESMIHPAGWSAALSWSPDTSRFLSAVNISGHIVLEEYYSQICNIYSLSKFQQLVVKTVDSEGLAIPPQF